MKIFVALLFCIFLVGLGCRHNREEAAPTSTAPSTAVVHIKNLTRVANVNSQTLVLDVGKRFVVEPSSEVVNSPYSSECKGYIERGLSSVGYTLVDSKANADFIVVYAFGSTQNRRMTTTVTFTGSSVAQPPRTFWVVSSSCSSRIGDIRGYLPGLVVGAVLHAGKSQGYSINSIGKHPLLLKAIQGY